MINDELENMDGTDISAIEELTNSFLTDAETQDEILNLIKSSIDISYWLYATDKPIGKWPGAEPINLEPVTYGGDFWTYGKQPESRIIPHQGHDYFYKRHGSWDAVELNLSEDFPWKIVDFFAYDICETCDSFDPDTWLVHQFLYLLDDKGEVIINFDDYWKWKKLKSANALRCIDLKPERDNDFVEELPF